MNYDYNMSFFDFQPFFYHFFILLPGLKMANRIHGRPKHCHRSFCIQKRQIRQFTLVVLAKLTRESICVCWEMIHTRVNTIFIFRLNVRIILYIMQSTAELWTKSYKKKRFWKEELFIPLLLHFFNHVIPRRKLIIFLL